MHRSQIRLTYEALGKIFDLPPDAFISGVVEDVNQPGAIHIRVMSERPAPEEFSVGEGHLITWIANLATIGEAYRNPENYPMKKGCCRGDSLDDSSCRDE